MDKHGYEIYRAHSGDEALNLVRELHPALLLLDILMPKMDGVEVCKIMRADVDLAIAGCRDSPDFFETGYRVQASNRNAGLNHVAGLVHALH